MYTEKTNYDITTANYVYTIINCVHRKINYVYNILNYVNRKTNCYITITNYVYRKTKTFNRKTLK